MKYWYDVYRAMNNYNGAVQWQNFEQIINMLLNERDKVIDEEKIDLDLFFEEMWWEEKEIRLNKE